MKKATMMLSPNSPAVDAGILKSIQPVLALGVTVEQLRAPGRPAELAELRRQAIALGRRAGYGVQELGKFFNRHHTAISYSLLHQQPLPHFRQHNEVIGA